MTEFVILRAIGLGDLLCAVPALRALGAAGRTELWTSPWLVPFAERFRLADRVLGVPSLDAPPPAPVGGRVAVNLHGSGPESHRLLLRAGASTLWAHRHPAVPASSAGPEWRPGEHEVERWRRLVAHHGVDASGHGLTLTPAGDRPPAGTSHHGRVLLHVGASAGARRWPVPRWVRLAERLRRRHVPFAVSAGPGEGHLLRPIVSAARLAPDEVVGPTSDLVAFAGIVAGARAVVVGDTGVGHLATAFDRPSVVLFGPVAPAQWGPPPSPLHTALWVGRTGDPHGHVVDEGLSALGVDQVWVELLAVLDRAEASGSARRDRGYGRAHAAAGRPDAPRPGSFGHTPRRAAPPPRRGAAPPR